MSVSSQLLVVLFLILPATSWSQVKYVVKPGDTILKVADRSLGNKDRKDRRRYELADRIRKMNPNLKDPNALEPGQILILPEPAEKEKSKVEEADHHAKPEKPAAQLEELVQSRTHPQTHAPAPAPAPAPVAAAESVETHQAAAQDPIAETKHHESAHSNFIFVQPRYQMVEISSQDLATKSTGTLKSKSSAGLDLQYGVILNDHFHLLFQAGITQTQFKDFEGEEVTINHTTETSKSFGAGLAYEATSQLHLDLMLMSAERTFLLPKNLPEYELESVMVPGAELSVSYDFFSGTANIFGISAIGEYLTKVEKDSVEYESAFEPFGSLYWKSKYGPDRVNYKLTLTYKHGHQDTSLSQQSEELTSLGLGFYF